MTTLREAVAQTLDALTKIHPGNMSWETGDAWLNAVQILREALAQPEPGPLTDEDVVDAVDPVEYHGWVLREVLFDQGEPVGHRAPPQRKPQPEQEPVAWMVYTLDGKSAFVTDNPTDFGPEHKALPLYTSPPQRKPLTDAEIIMLSKSAGVYSKVNDDCDLLFARAIEQAHGIA